MKKQFIHEKYEEVKLLGQGTFGKVYEAFERGNPQKRVAIKQIEIPNNLDIIHSLKQEGLTNAEITHELEKVAGQITKEIEIMESLNGYSNIVNIQEYEFLTIDTPKNDIKKKYVINIVMELLKSLDKELERDTFTNKDALKLGKDIAKALIACEDQNIIHRDVKIENIFIDSNGNYKLGDFGEAKNIDKTLSNMTRRGTENYMAPELYKGEEGNKTIDIYALGIVLYRIFNNKKQPFLNPDKNTATQDEREASLKKRILGDTIPSPKNADDELSKIILKCIDYNPLKRYSSAKDLYNDLVKYDKNVTNKKNLFIIDVYKENEKDKELVKKEDLNIIRVIELTENELNKGCKKKIIIDGKKVDVDIPASLEKDEIILPFGLLKEYGVIDRKKVTLIIAKKEEKYHKKNNYILLIPLLIVGLIVGFILINNIDKPKKELESAKKMICTIKDISSKDGQYFSYQFEFNQENNAINKIYFTGNYPPFEEGLTKEDFEYLANEYKEYFCNDKIILSNTCDSKVLSDNYIELSFEMNPDEYMDTYRPKRINNHSLLEDIKLYYEKRKEDACEELFTIEKKACSGRYQASCEVSQLDSEEF